MSTSVLPNLPVGFSLKRTILWATRKNEAVSGAEVTIRDRAYPRYEWELPYEVLRQGNVGDPTGWPWNDFSTLFGFYNKMGGGWDSFLYFDNMDFQVTGASCGTGDGVTTTFQLVKGFGGFAEPVYAPVAALTRVYLNGVLQTNYTLNLWGTSAAAGPGTIQFGFTPGVGQLVTADVTYAYPCRFVEDQCQFEQFANGFWNCKSLKFKSILLGYSE